MAESITQSIGNEISQSSGSDEIIIPVGNEILQSSGSGTNSMAEDEQPNAGRQRWEKPAKILIGVAMTLSGPIITAGVANNNKSGGGELILFKASVALALISFFTGLTLLISVLLYENVRRTVLFGLISVAVFSVFAGVVVLAFSNFI